MPYLKCFTVVYPLIQKWFEIRYKHTKFKLIIAQTPTKKHISQDKG
jgi:hypothetical protein